MFEYAVLDVFLKSHVTGHDFSSCRMNSQLQGLKKPCKVFHAAKEGKTKGGAIRLRRKAGSFPSPPGPVCAVWRPSGWKYGRPRRFHSGPLSLHSQQEAATSDRVCLRPGMWSKPYVGIIDDRRAVPYINCCLQKLR